MKFSTILAAAFATIVIAAPAPAPVDNFKLKVRGVEYTDIIERALNNLQLAKREIDSGLDTDEDASLGICLKVKRDIDSLFE